MDRSHPREDPRELYAALLAAYGAGTREALAEIVVPEVTYTIHGSATLSGEYRGIDGMLSWMATAMELSGGSVRFTPDEVLTNETTLVAIGRVELVRGGHSIRTGHIYRLRFADGRLVEGHTYPTDASEFDDAWS
jgi:ketosteroid isomerase-like protein